MRIEKPKQSKLSIIIPTLNEESMIRKTLKNIQAQDTRFHYDVFICDGGSTDRTVELAKKYAKVLVSPKRGKSKQLNYAANRINADILVFLDADTMIIDNYLQHIFDLFENDKHLWACGMKFKFWFEGTSRQRFSIRMANLMIPRYFGISNLFGFTKLPGCNISMRREIFQTIGGFKDIPNEDSELCTAMINLAKDKGYGKVQYLTKPVIECSPRRVLELGAFGLIQYYRKKEKQRFKQQK